MNLDVKAAPEWPARKAKARATRAAIIDAAGDLFVELGYLGTSIQTIADVAGVSRATVFNSVGGKLALLKTAFDVATVGDDEPVPLPQRPQALAVRAEPDARKAVAGYAAMVTGVSSRVAGIYEAFRCAAGVDLRVRVQWTRVQQERFGGAKGFVEILSAKGPLRDGLTPEDAADLVWVLIDASLYHRLVIERSWTTSTFQTWLTATMEAQLLPPNDKTEAS
ncbi:MAG: putative TetR family transcriptional regulator [Acidimicrobiaceae bacterium]|nr:putative TetR family transcriptional regulator [Acidimicrobiaceae bacterium]